MRRRRFVHWLGAVLGASAPVGYVSAQRALIEVQRNWRSMLSPTATIAESTMPLLLSDQKWEQRLGTEQHRVLRQGATEHPFSSPLTDEERPGIYVCVACDLPVFTSEMKYDPGTGWPSFFTSIPGSFDTERDGHLFLSNVEYHCRRCGGHHGHLFDDGPEPTHERWCNNGVALRFIPRDD